jgi:hypothetical protein
LNVVRRILVLLLLLPAVGSAGPVVRALGAAAMAAAGEDMCLSFAAAVEQQRGGDDGVAHLPCADCCLTSAGSGGVPPNMGKEAFLRLAFFPASPLLETVTTAGPGDPLRHALWIRGPPAAAPSA